MPGNGLLEPIDEGEFGYAQAVHLLNRAGFGGRPEEVVELWQLGLERAVDLMVDGPSGRPDENGGGHFDPDILTGMELERERLAKAIQEDNAQEIQDLERKVQERRTREMIQRQGVEEWWLRRMTITPWPLQEKLTLMWHGHFPCRYQDVGDSYLMWQQNDLLRREALGNFAQLLHGMMEDPAMILSLNSHDNAKGRENEQMAGMVLEQFALGAGQASGQDVREAAKALTGQRVKDNRFEFDRAGHHEGPKTVLGHRGNLDPKSLARILLSHPATSRHVAGLLYREFVGELGDNATEEAGQVVEGLARLLTARGYELRPVLRVLFKSRHFYDPAVAGGLVKSPGQLVAGTVRVLGTPYRQWRPLTKTMREMGQGLFDPPLWGGWPCGAAWINTSTLYARQNVCIYLITEKEWDDGQWAAEMTQYDPTVLLRGALSNQPEAVVEHLVGTMIPGPIAPQRRAVLVNYMKERKGVTSRSVLGLVLLITALPEYQMC